MYFKEKPLKKKHYMLMKNSVIYVKKSSVMIKTVQTTKKTCKVRDHCHFTGNYRSAAHSICNLKYKLPKDIPVVFIMALYIIII